jgi:hypothetical protein
MKTRNGGSALVRIVLRLIACAAPIIAVLLVGGTMYSVSNAAAVSPARSTTLNRAAYMGPPTEVYIYNQSGTPIYISADSYVSPHVYDGFDNLIGTVPNPTTDGHIYDANNNSVGFIDPSPAATNEL